MPTETFFNLSDEKRGRIISESKKMFIDMDYCDVNIRAIAKNCGISIGSFYQYFKDKDDLYIYLIIEFEKIVQDIEQSVCKDLMFDENIEYMPQVICEDDRKFNMTWSNVPEDVMRKFYFKDYLEMVRPIFIKIMEEFKSKGKVREDIDIDFFVYMYTTSLFNIQLYAREQKITDEVEKFNMKKEYLRNILPYGIFK